MGPFAISCVSPFLTGCATGPGGRKRIVGGGSTGASAVRGKAVLGGFSVSTSSTSVWGRAVGAIFVFLAATGSLLTPAQGLQTLPFWWTAQTSRPHAGQTKAAPLTKLPQIRQKGALSESS